jgi:uncharacterized protein YbbC (DUF1343 family)
MNPIITGLEKLSLDAGWQKKITGNIALLAHSASIDSNYNHAINIFKEIFGNRLTKVFGPQHGFVSDVQDNMIETEHFTHPYFDIPIYSLYGETRIPTDQMLEGIDSIVVDLQDVGTRIYTYIYTLTHLMEACSKKDIKVFVLDRPNPIGGEIIEGNVLSPVLSSFVGRHPIPTRHGLTIGEVASMANNYFGASCDLSIIPMENWQRHMDFSQTGLPWVSPSPNLPRHIACYSFVGTVMFEGTNISEGRGTTSPLEIIGHPDIEPYQFADHLNTVFKEYEKHNQGFHLRPIAFHPMFQKHSGKTCGGIHIHVTNNKTFRPWSVCQIICRELYKVLGDKFKWKQPPYEYEDIKMPIDMINGGTELRKWVEKNGSLKDLEAIELAGREKYLNQRKTILLY